jgi:GNAT superfamily N-acetyltransferase
VVATENGTLIGHAMAADTGDAAEIAVVVADSWQRRGVGAAMGRALGARARARGVTSLVMEVLAENRVVLAMIESHWPSARYDRSAADVTVRMPADLVSAPRRPYTPTVPSMPSRSRSA